MSLSDKRDRMQALRDINASDAFRNTLLPRRDAVTDGGYPLWHGWAIMDAFLAGAAFARSTTPQNPCGIKVGDEFCTPCGRHALRIEPCELSGCPWKKLASMPSATACSRPLITRLAMEHGPMFDVDLDDGTNLPFLDWSSFADWLMKRERAADGAGEKNG